MLSPGVQRWPAPAARRARACSSVSASTHHSSTRVTSILAWNSRVFASGAAAGAVLDTVIVLGAVPGVRNSALLAGMVYVRISGLWKSRHLAVQNKEETPVSVPLWNVSSLNIVEFGVPRSSE